MDFLRILAIVLLVGGALGLAYGGFSYTKATHTADIGPLHLEVTEKQRVNIPMWAGFGAVLVGGLLLVGSRKH
jgi:TRAP-type C4-dicarboxylate transport system permease small subunit